MNLNWFERTWDDYLYWQTQDKKTLKRINQLIRDTERDPFQGVGKPEPLKGELNGFWSRRIDAENRLVYRVNGNLLEILSCRGTLRMNVESESGVTLPCGGISTI